MRLGLKIVIKKVFWGERIPKFHGSWNQRNTDSICFDVYIGLHLQTLKESFYKNFETSALEIRALQIPSHQMNHFQVFPKALLEWRLCVPNASQHIHKTLFRQTNGCWNVYIFHLFAFLKKQH